MYFKCVIVSVQLGRELVFIESSNFKPLWKYSTESPYVPTVFNCFVYRMSVTAGLKVLALSKQKS